MTDAVSLLQVAGQLATAVGFEELFAVTTRVCFALTNAGTCRMWRSDGEGGLVYLGGLGRVGNLLPPPSQAEQEQAAAQERSESVNGGDGNWGILRDGFCYGVLQLAYLDGTAAVHPAFDALLINLGVAMANLDKYAALERLIEDELVKSVEREAALQLTLDSMHDGLLVCDLTGAITGVRSAVVERWFGAPDEGTAVWSYLAAHDAQLASDLELGFTQLFEDILPFEVSAEQMPQEFERAGRRFRLECQAIEDCGCLSQVVISVRDVTAQVAAELAEAEQRELIVILGGLLRNRDGFAVFLDEVQRLLDSLEASREYTEIARILHTLKGNAAVQGFVSYARRCHHAEDELESFDYEQFPRTLHELRNAWQRELERIADFVEDSQSGTVMIAMDEYHQVLEALEGNELKVIVQGWCHPTFEKQLECCVGRVPGIAASLGKSARVQLESGTMRLPTPLMQSMLSSFVHLFRNAIDHGIEAPEERERLGKPRAGVIRIQIDDGLEQFRIIVSDDGRGIDWGAVRARACERGLPHGEHSDLVNALFTDGVSTARALSEISGRGVGMAAVRQECRALGGEIHVTSAAGEGASFEFCLPPRQVLAVQNSSLAMNGAEAARLPVLTLRPMAMGS